MSNPSKHHYQEEYLQKSLQNQGPLDSVSANRRWGLLLFCNQINFFVLFISFSTLVYLKDFRLVTFPLSRHIWKFPRKIHLSALMIGEGENCKPRKHQLWTFSITRFLRPQYTQRDLLVNVPGWLSSQDQISLRFTGLSNQANTRETSVAFGLVLEKSSRCFSGYKAHGALKKNTKHFICIWHKKGTKMFLLMA